MGIVAIRAYAVLQSPVNILLLQRTPDGLMTFQTKGFYLFPKQAPPASGMRTVAYGAFPFFKWEMHVAAQETVL